MNSLSCGRDLRRGTRQTGQPPRCRVVLDDTFADGVAERFIDCAELNRNHLDILRIDRLPCFLDQSPELRFYVDVARPPLQALLMSLDD